MKFFFPDSSDHVDPTFDFEAETRNRQRVRQREDLYAHEIFDECPYDGILISKGLVERGASRYTESQRQRLVRMGAPAFFRAKTKAGRKLEILGDCGAFSYVREPEPPYSVDDVIQFYVDCDVDYGISVDHVILQYEPAWDHGNYGAGEQKKDAVARQGMTLERAQEFFRTHKSSKLRFEPLGAAQGWSPRSYAEMVSQLQKMGYRYIAVGGLVPLKTPEILAILEEVNRIRHPDTKLHLLGVTRCDKIHEFVRLGAASFDSTSPLRQAFKDMKDNYYTLDGTFPAIRVPQVDANLGLKRRIAAGRVDQGSARKLERECLRLLSEFDSDTARVRDVVTALAAYESLCDPKSRRAREYHAVLDAKPWRDCVCEVCQAIGIHVILFRGAERNRRRGFHNLFVFRQRLDRATDRLAPATRTRRSDRSSILQKEKAASV